MKAFPWITTAILLVVVYILYGSLRSKTIELNKAQESAAEVETLRSENENLRKLPDQQAEIDRLTHDNAEMLRLRNEVQQLRGQSKQLSTELNQAKVSTEESQRTQQQLADEVQSMRTNSQSSPEAAGVGEQGTNAATVDLTPAQKNAALCIANLRQIEGAKQQWALENKKTVGDLPAFADLTPYLPNPAKIICPDGGHYEINVIGSPATCTVQGHTLNPQ